MTYRTNPTAVNIPVHLLPSLDTSEDNGYHNTSMYPDYQQSASSQQQSLKKREDQYAHAQQQANPDSRPGFQTMNAGTNEQLYYDERRSESGRGNGSENILQQRQGNNSIHSHQQQPSIGSMQQGSNHRHYHQRIQPPVGQTYPHGQHQFAAQNRPPSEYESQPHQSHSSLSSRAPPGEPQAFTNYQTYPGNQVPKEQHVYKTTHTQSKSYDNQYERSQFIYGNQQQQQQQIPYPIQSDYQSNVPQVPTSQYGYHNNQNNQYLNYQQGQPGSTRYAQMQPNQPTRQTARRAPSHNLPPIQTNQVLDNNGRRIVSSPSYPNQNSPRDNSDIRTKSLSRATTQPMLSNQNQSTNSLPSSNRTFSLSSKSRSFTSLSKLSSLSTKKFSSSSSSQNNGPPKVDRVVSQSTITSKNTASKKPQVYPALLSRVAKVFKDSMILTINTKDGLEYHDTFTGKMAVDIICRIIRTNDRNLALLLGRSLDAQKFFHDVSYNHRLRDSVHEVFAFNRAFSDVEFFEYSNGNSSVPSSKHGSFNAIESIPGNASITEVPSSNSLTAIGSNNSTVSEVNGVFTILTDCYSPTCTRNRLCYSISCPRRLEQQARLNLKPSGGLRRAVSRLSLNDDKKNKKLWHETVPASISDKLDKHEKMRQELIFEFIYTERDYVKDLEFLTDFYIMPLRNPANNIIPERERDAFIRTVFGGVSDLLWLAKQLSEALTRRQQQQSPVIETFADVFLKYVGQFEPFVKYSGNKVFAQFEHERQQQVNLKYARFLDAIEKKPESRKQDLSSFLIKGVQRPARYQLFLGGIIKNTKEDSPDYKNLIKAKEEIEKVLTKINIQTGESTDRHKIMVIHRLLGKQTLEEKFKFRLNYSHRIIYQVTLNRKRDNEKIDVYLFDHALLLVKHKFQNKREQHKVFERPVYLPLLFVNSGSEFPSLRQIMSTRMDGSLLSDPLLKQGKIETNYVGGGSGVPKLQLNFLGLGKNQVHCSLFAEDVANQSQLISQVYQQQKKLIEKNDIFSISKFETRKFHGNNKINCAVPCYGGKKLLYGTDSGVWVSTVRSISAVSNEKICSDPTMVISKLYVTQIEVLVEYGTLLILSDKTLYEFDLSCTDSLDHVKNTRSGKEIINNVSFFKSGICEERLLVVAVKKGSSGGQHSINIFEPHNPFDTKSSKNYRSKKYDVREFGFSSDPVSISFFKRKLCVGCVKGFEILSLEDGRKEPILDEADPSLDFATQRESVTPLAIHRLGYNFLVSYSEFSFLINKNGWRTSHDWGIFWEGSPQNIAIFYPYLLAFEPGFIEVRELDSTNLLRALVGENIRFLHSNEHEALYACEENGYDIIVSIDFLNLKPKREVKSIEKK